jgi:hypothetical protein
MWGGKQLFAFLGGGAAGAVQSLTSASPTEIHRWVIPFRCRPIRVGFTLTTAVTVQSAILRFDVINKTVAAAAQTTTTGACGTITMPVNTAGIGKCYYENTDYVGAGTGAWVGSLAEGDIVKAMVTQASTAGAGIPFLVVEVDPEQPANNASMISG